MITTKMKAPSSKRKLLHRNYSINSKITPFRKMTQKQNSWKIDSCLLVLKGGQGWTILSKWTLSIKTINKVFFWIQVRCKCLSQIGSVESEILYFWRWAVVLNNDSSKKIWYGCFRLAEHKGLCQPIMLTRTFFAPV